MFLFVPCFPSGAMVLFFGISPSLLSQSRLPPPHYHHLTHIPFALHICMSIFNMFQSPLRILSSIYTDFDSPHQPKFTHQLCLQTPLFPSCIPNLLTKSTSPHPPLLPPTAFTPLFLFHHDFLLSWSEALLSPDSGIMTSFAPFLACIRLYMCQILLIENKQVIARDVHCLENLEKNFCILLLPKNAKFSANTWWEVGGTVLRPHCDQLNKQCFIDSGIVC